MSIKLSDTIKKIKHNGKEIILGKINGYIVFTNNELSLNVTINVTDKNIIVTSNTAGNYDVYYADDIGVLNEYGKITTFELLKDESKIYDKLNTLNIAPLEATKIILCKNGETSELASSPIPDVLKFDNSKYGAKLYSVGVLSDIHIDGDGTDESYSQEDFTRALRYFSDKVNFIAICGDISSDFDNTTEFNLFNSLKANYNLPIKICAGNHDLGSHYETYLGIEKQYIYNVEDDVYIFLSCNAWDGTNPLTTEQINWLENVLETNKNKRKFLFFHFFCNPVGNINNIYSSEYLSTSSGTSAQFRNLINKYKDNLIYFSGHSHLQFALQELGENANISEKTTNMPKRVHISSCSKPRDENRNKIDAASEGYIMDVYENCVVLKGRDFVGEKYLPIATYLLDTTLIEYEEEPEISNYFVISSDYTYNSSGGTSTSGSKLSNVTYTFNKGDSNFIANGTPSSSTSLSFFSDKILKSGETYKLSYTLNSGSINATKNYACRVRLNSSYSTSSQLAEFYIKPVANSYKDYVLYTPTSDINGFYIILSATKTTTSYNNANITINVEKN